jgi:DNA polymerase-3 subunit delta
MVMLKAQEVDGFLARPNERYTVVLVYGPDDGLVAERAGALVKRLSGGSDDPFSLVRLDGVTVTQDPARLIDEASTVSLFGSRRVIWLREGRDGRVNLQPALTPLFETALAGSVVVVEAGDLKKGAWLRRRAEETAHAVALPCYADSAAELERIIAEETAAAGLTIDPAARAVLERLLGADRLATRGEVRKLCLYALGRDRITEEDVAAIVGDASALVVDDLSDAVAGGDPTAADVAFGRLIRGGMPASVAAGAIVRHFHLLQRLRAAVDTGVTAGDAVGGTQPPVHFRRKAAIARQISLWPAPRIVRALRLIDDAILTDRRNAGLGEAAISAALLQLARAARVGGRRR